MYELTNTTIKKRPDRKFHLGKASLDEFEARERDRMEMDHCK